MKEFDGTLDLNEYAGSHSEKFAYTMRNGMPIRKLWHIAREIRTNWDTVTYAAAPYLDAMATLDAIDDNYYMDTGASIVRYFLANASAWRGSTARVIKAELNSMLQ